MGRLPAALTDVGVAESVLRVDGDASARLHHQVPQAPAAEEHDEEAQPRRHVAPRDASSLLQRRRTAAVSIS